jgi:quaternary ammonium compound-resistance protein SugE
MNVCAMTAWVALMLAGAMEIVWAIGLKYSDGFTRLWPTIGTIVTIPLSFLFLALSLRAIPFGTAYAIWAGIGVAGAVLVDMLLFGERADLLRILCLVLIMIGTIGLKLMTRG